MLDKPFLAIVRAPELADLGAVVFFFLFYEGDLEVLCFDDLADVSGLTYRASVFAATATGHEHDDRVCA